FSASIMKVTLALLDAANDKDPAVQEQVRKSVLTLGKQQPDRVLAMCQDYLLKHPKLVVIHRVVILQTIELIVSTRIEDVSASRIKSIISLASDEMTRSKVLPDWQQAASNILVAVGNKYINDIMEEILSKFQPGVLPHFFVVQTLANLSDSNVYGMVPFLNAILGTMLPMLGIAKQDNMKWVFSSALCHFSDSILEYLANLDKAPDPTVRKDTFCSEIYAAYEILFNTWIQSREPKLRLTVADAVGSMCHLMPSDKLEEQIPKIIPTIMSLYKKNNEHYVISKSLCQVIDASVNMGSRVLETQLDGLLFVLHHFCLSHWTSPCAVLSVNSFPDRLVMFVLQKLENSNERSRMGSLAVLRHLINSSTATMESKKLLILASIRQPMADHSNKVKKRVVQVISAMAHHGYLELEGGELLVRFIVQNCALPDTFQRSQRPTDPEEVTNEALRTMCDNTLHLLTTTVGRLADVLWPKLLYYLTPSQYSNATSPLCKSLIVLGSKKKTGQEPTFPFNSRGHGAPSLSLLQVLSINIHPNTETLWEKEIPPLLAMLEGRKMLPSNVYFQKEMLCLNCFPNLFLYRCIGVTLQHCFNKEFVKKQLQEILLAARHNDAVEREGVAMGIGLCANSHLEGTLAKLEEFGKSDAFKKSQSIFNLLKDRNDVEVEKVKSTLILCYGQVALNAPPETILNRIDQDILRSISKHFNTKVLSMSQETSSLIQSVGLIAKAIGVCVKKQGYVFSRKQELISVMLDFIKSEQTDSLRTPVRHLVMSTCANLLYPLLQCFEKRNFLITQQSFQCLKWDQHDFALYKDTLAALQELLKSVLARDPTPDGLQNVFKHIETWLNSGRDHERERAIIVTSHILAYFLDHLNVKNMVSFHNVGALLGRLSPRCSDPLPAIRAAAIDCIYSLLYIQLRYEGFSLDYKDEAVEGLLPFKDELENPDHSVLYKTCSDLTKRLPQQQLTTLVFMLFEGLVDSQTNCCRASSVILNTLLKNRGGGLQDLVPEMLEVLHVCLQSITDEQVKVAVGQTVLILASQHLQTVINTLINQPLPYDSWTSEIWMSLGADPIVATQIIEMVMEKLVVMAPYVDKKEMMTRGGTTKVATSPPLAVNDMWPQRAPFKRELSGAHSQPVSSPLLLPHCPTGSKCRVAADALRILLARVQLDEVSKRLEEDKAWDAIKEASTHITGVTLLAKAMAKHAGPRLPAIIECLCPFLNNIYECQRITVTAFFSELLNHHVVTELMLIDVLLNNMMERVSDPCCTVRMLAVRGLGNIATGSPEKVNNDDIRYASILLMGNLSKFGSGEPVFKDQIHNVLVSLLLHLVDPDPQVVKACKFAMRVCAPVVGSEQITAMFQNHLHDDKSLHYGEFINDLTKYLIQDFPGMLNFYHISVIQFFKSNWPEVRAAAAMFIGTVAPLPVSESQMFVVYIFTGLVMLLQDSDPVVRVKAAEAMGQFH
uniref:Maestro heat-like repeat family member 1 n=1 Tax=Oryzias sinensis TaxID=183150 RepID=A0A8C7X9D7_9TELE